MSNFGLNCDVCNRQNVGVTWANGMKFCAKCYQETFGASKGWQLLDKDKTIYELETKLSQKERDITVYEEIVEDLESNVVKKDKELTRLKKNWNNSKSQYKRFLANAKNENQTLEKALELACEQIWAMSIWENTKEEVIQDSIEFFKDKAKEIMKSETAK